MRASALLTSAAIAIEEVGAAVRTAVPSQWRGNAAAAYQVRAAVIAGSIEAIASGAHESARLARLHDVETEAVRTALAGGGMVAV